MEPCSQEWTAAVPQLPQSGHLCGTWSWVARRASIWERSLSAVGPSGRILPKCPRWQLLLPPVFQGPFLQSCPARVSCPLGCVFSQRREKLALFSIVEDRQSTAYSMAGNGIGLLCQTQCYDQFSRPLRDHQGPQLQYKYKGVFIPSLDLGHNPPCVTG